MYWSQIADHSWWNFKNFSSTYQFMHVTSSRRHPQGIGLTEKTVGTVKTWIKKEDVACRRRSTFAVVSI